MTLGGGCEVAMGADRMRVHGELYMGLVEVGAGLIPGGGGTKELLIRNMKNYTQKGPFPSVRQTFETIAFAKVSMSAKEAKKIGYLNPQDRISMNRDQLLFDAKQDVLEMAKDYQQPKPLNDIQLPGPSGRLVLESAIKDLQMTGKISEHDALIGKKLAFVLTGGNILPSQKASEQQLLDLEREAFLSLCGEEKTQARMENLLTKGKPLRN
jgi:3-hydroxyacyl-CoA dehydrogenase